MAKAAAKVGGTSRIRFVMFDAEVAEGEIGQITQAIQNALRGPSQVSVQRLPNPTALKAPEANGHDQSADVEAPSDEEILDVTPTPAPRQPRARRTVAKMPKVISIDMESDVSFASFANGKDAGSQHKKFLIVAAWLAEHRNTPAVTEDHVFTCFKSIGWPLNIPDFGQPLRDIKTKRQFFEKSDKGYEINHLGLAYVKKLGGENGAT